MVKVDTTHILLGGMFSLGTHHPIPSWTPPNITHSQPLPKTSTKVTNVPSFSPGSAASHMADASGKFHFINEYGKQLWLTGRHSFWMRKIYIYSLLYIYIYIYIYKCIYGCILICEHNYSTSLKARLSIASLPSCHTGVCMVSLEVRPPFLIFVGLQVSPSFGIIIVLKWWHGLPGLTTISDNLPKHFLENLSWTTPVGFHIRTEQFRLKETNDYPL